MAGGVILNKLSEIVVTHSGTPVYTLKFISQSLRRETAIKIEDQILLCCCSFRDT